LKTLTFGWINKHDAARDKYDRGEITQVDYMGASLEAGVESGIYLTATMATGGIAGIATKGMSLTSRLLITGAVGNMGYQAADDIVKGEFSGAGAYLKAGGTGALTGGIFRGSMALKPLLGKASGAVRQGMQVMKSAAKGKGQALKRMTTEVKSGLHDAGQKLVQKGKSSSVGRTLANQRGGVRFGDRRAYLSQKFRGSATGSLDKSISAGKGYSQGILPKGVTFEGTLYRAAKAGYDPKLIHPGNIAASHRYTGPGQGGLYLSSGKNIVRAEMGSMRGMKMHSFDVKASNLLDLTNPAVRQKIGAKLNDLVRNSGTKAWDYQVTQPLGRWAKQHGYRGIIAPSAQADGGVNILLFNIGVLP